MSATAYNQRLATLEIGLAGCHGSYAGENSTVSIPDRQLSAYFGEVIEGGYVIDKADCLDKRPSLAVLSPMCRGSLPPGTRNGFDIEPDNFIANVLANEGPENGFSGCARLMLAAPKCGAFDDVAPDVFAAWWHEHGARVGVRRGDTIQWHDGTIEQIRPFAKRWECER